MAESTGTYHSPAINIPNLDEVTKLSEELNLKCTAEELEAITAHVKTAAGAYQRLSQLQEPALPVKYPRTSGYRPSPEDNPYNAWYWRCDVIGAKSGKLAGKTIGIKDNIAVSGVPMMNGSKILEGYTPEFDATVVTRILDAGGRIIGKTACEDLCFSGNSFTCSTGPVRNPHDETRTTGGSSCGSAALVAGGKVDMAMGGDQGGSVRIPSSWSGIVGLKPTFGLVPYTGAMPIEISLDHLGPMTRTVYDCALLLEVIAGFDEGRDPRQHPFIKVPEYTQELDAGIAGKKIGVLKEGFDLCTEKDVADCIRKAVERLKEAGATVEEVSIPFHLDGSAIWSGVGLQGGYNCMAKGNGNGYFWKGHYALSLQEAASRGFHTRPHDLSVIVKMVSILAEHLNRKYQNKFYAKAQNIVMALTKAYDKTLEKYDVLVMPTLPHKAPKLPSANSTTTELFTNALSMLSIVSPFNLSGHPALTINTGLLEGLPVGMMIVGRHFDEKTVLQVARIYEKIRDGI